jgi:hypothetical protein
MTCCNDTIHVNDVGTQFIVTIEDCNGPIDISAYTPLQLTFAKPDGTTSSKTATFYTDGTDGKIQYITLAGDIDMAGEWKIQGLVSGFHSSIGSFTVQRNL